VGQDLMHTILSGIESGTALYLRDQHRYGVETLSRCRGTRIFVFHLAVAHQKTDGQKDEKGNANDE